MSDMAVIEAATMSAYMVDESATKLSVDKERADGDIVVTSPSNKERS